MSESLIFITKAAPDIAAYTGRSVPPNIYNRLKRLAYSGQFRVLSVNGSLAFPEAEMPKVCAALGFEPLADQAAAAAAIPEGAA